MLKKIKKRNIFLLFLVIVLCLSGIPESLLAQYNTPRNNVWAFGVGIGVDFNSGNPTPITSAINLESSQNSLTEASATVCDKSGNLLFYTNGSCVWDRNNNLMPGNLNALHGQGTASDPLTQSTTQGAVIVPMPRDADKYFVFSLTGFGGNQTSATGELFYSVVDMTLNNGMGDIVPGEKWIELDSVLTEKMVAIRGTRDNVWIVVHDMESNSFKAFDVTACGINPNPVISQTGSFGIISKPNLSPHNMYYATGMMVANHSGTRLAMCNEDSHSASLFDFDKNTGIVSNEMLFDTTNVWYAAAFSPDDSRLYISNIDFMHMIYQFDLSAPTLATLMATKTAIIGSASSQMRIGPDGKLYFRSNTNIPTVYTLYMGRIENPNAPAASLVVNNVAVTFPPLVGSFNSPMGQYIGFGAAVIDADSTQNQPLYVVHKDTLSCYDTSLVLNGPVGQESYEWNDQSTDSALIIHDPGIYWVKSIKNCELRVDTFKVETDLDNLGVDLGNDTMFCSGNTLVLHVPNVFGASYIWQDGTGGQNYNATKSGTYWIKITKGFCIKSDTIHLTVVKVKPNLGEDQSFCFGSPIQITLQSNAVAGAAVKWNDGSTADSLLVIDTGTYWVSVTDSGCVGRDTINITNKFCGCQLSFPNAFTPNGDGLNDVFGPFPITCPAVHYHLYIFNRYGQRVFQTANVEDGWNGYFNGKPMDVGTYFFEASFEPLGGNGEIQQIKGSMSLIR